MMRVCVQYTCQDGSVCGSTAAATTMPSIDVTATTGVNATIAATAMTTAAPGAGIGDAGSCPDYDALCKAVKHCTDCVPKKGYVVNVYVYLYLTR